MVCCQQGRMPCSEVKFVVVLTVDHWYYQASTGGYFCQGLVLSLANLLLQSPLVY